MNRRSRLFLKMYIFAMPYRTDGNSSQTVLIANLYLESKLILREVIDMYILVSILACRNERNSILNEMTSTVEFPVKWK